MKNTIEEVIVNDELVYLKKSKIFGWGVVYPIKINGKINWKNLIAGGSWIRLGFIALMILLLIGAIKEYSSALELANNCLENCLNHLIK